MLVSDQIIRSQSNSSVSDSSSSSNSSSSSYNSYTSWRCLHNNRCYTKKTFTLQQIALTHKRTRTQATGHQATDCQPIPDSVFRNYQQQGGMVTHSGQGRGVLLYSTHGCTDSVNFANTWMYQLYSTHGCINTWVY